MELIKGFRVPSYKKIAMTILKNDLKMQSLGFSGADSQLANEIAAEKKRMDSPQYDLF